MVGSKTDHHESVPDSLVGRSTELRPFRPNDFDFAYGLHLEPRNLVSYRLRGSVPSPESFHRFLWDQALANFVVSNRSRHPIGIVSAYGADHRNATCYVAAVGSEDAQDGGLMVESIGLLVTYLFLAFPFRKVYMESLQSNYSRFASGEGRFFTLEARLREHEYVDGKYQDMVILAIYKSDWVEVSKFIYSGRHPMAACSPPDSCAPL